MKQYPFWLVTSLLLVSLVPFTAYGKSAALVSPLLPDMSLNQTFFYVSFICLLSMLVPAFVAAQDLPVPDSVRAREEILKQKRTKEDTIRKKIDQEKIIRDLEAYSKRKTIFGRAVKAVFNFKRKPEEVGRDAEILTQVYREHDFKVIRTITIRNLNSFGYSVTDTARRPDNFLEKTGNALHIKTSRRLIRNQLLFRKGQLLEPLMLAESERLLRQTPHIVEARILVNEATSTADSVDVLVITKDVFSTGVGGAYNSNNGRTILTLRDINFLGQGHQLRSTYKRNANLPHVGPGEPQNWFYKGSYTIENLYKTFISADIFYHNENQYKTKGFNFRRDFFATTTKYAGAFGTFQVTDERSYRDTDSVRHYFTTRFTVNDMWLGRSYGVKTYDLNYTPRGRFITALRLINTRFQQNSGIHAVMYMGTIGYSVRKYYKDNYLFGFGRTEDIPAGNLITLTGGFETTRLQTRPYLGVKNTFGKYRSNLGYLYIGAEYGSFYNPSHSRWEQGALTTELLYFTRLYAINNWRWRQFIWHRMAYGINRFGTEELNINNNEGLRGFSSTARGSRRLVFNFESNFYTPLSFLGFRLATVLFADLAWLPADKSEVLLRTTPFQGYGLAFRFRNEYMAFSTIQVALSYYPQIGPADFNNTRFFTAQRPYYNFRDFGAGPPAIPEFR